MATKRSEGQAWDGVEELGSSLLASKDDWVRHIGRELMATAAEMRGQLRKGLHTNPLVIYGNPGETMTFKTFRVHSDRMYGFQYKHLEDGVDYDHPFSPGVQLIAGTVNGAKVYLIRNKQGKPVWKDF